LKSDLIHARLGVIRDDLPFEVETDASDYAIAAILSQGGRPGRLHVEKFKQV